ncbi:MAG TPA: peptidase S8 [Flavobacteriaceae bacterium]|nr:peptidase S8 [Flavobacteriaceae bacterium]
MKKTTFIILFFLVCNLTFSQEHAWVYFKDKPDEATFLANPLTMLTQKALDRRGKQNISLDSKDIPIAEMYETTIRNANGIQVKAKSKWLNALHILGSETDIKALSNLSFVKSVDFAANDLNAKSVLKKQHKFDIQTEFNYGGSFNQIEMLKGEVLHQKGFTGEGMTIAVMDGGFPGVNTLSAFQRMRDNNQIKGGYDYVQRNANFYTGFSHGTSVLSTMAGFVDEKLVGTAPDADYYLFITEKGATETPLEESLWVEAAEKADSLGVDVINTSLGYNTFDDSRYNYTYADMNGKTTFITRGADIAFSRGMIVVNSAGNEGDKTWRYITAPGDGFNVLTIGAVYGNESIVAFSSFGPSADGRTKPDVLAKGGATTIINRTGNVTTGNGTSFSSPVICGVIACFWQANPTKTNAEIIKAIKESGHLYANPTSQEGYGIPDFEKAITTLTVDELFFDTFKVYPNPFQDKLQFYFANISDEIEVSIYDVLGRKVLIQQLNQQQSEINTEFLSQGIYLVQIKQDGNSKTFTVLKR